MSSKDANMKRNGSFNKNYANVSASIFEASPFFDKRDIVQVKYEMVRAASRGEGSIYEIAAAHGFSRKSYYQTSKAFESGGLCALVPKKTGPKGPTKINCEITAYIEGYYAEHPKAGVNEISEALKEEKGVKVHPRTIYRHVKKNQPTIKQ